MEWTRPPGAIKLGVLTWSSAQREERDGTGPHHRYEEIPIRVIRNALEFEFAHFRFDYFLQKANPERE